MALDRYLLAQIQDDLKRKMVFLGGPRQCGKTTLARKLLKSSEGYLNWDDPDDRSLILNREFPVSQLWVFDELHKYRGWRNYLKGLYDKKNPQQKILVTGSARLDLYRYGGDSLQGRYHFLRLHPLSLAELHPKATQADLKSLMELGGFPEPFFGSSKTQANRWSLEYRRRLAREDVSDLERLLDLTKLERLLLALPTRVGSPLSINSFREDLETSHKSVAHWLDVLEKVYSIFRLSPFGSPKIKAVKKEQKHYHFDWNLITEPGPRFENLVACHLLKWTQYREDTQGEELELRYFRDTLGREVDFVIVEKNRPKVMIECKFSDDALSPALRYLKAKFPECDAWQISMDGKKDYLSPEGIRVSPARELLKKLI